MPGEREGRSRGQAAAPPGLPLGDALPSPAPWASQRAPPLLPPFRPAERPSQRPPAALTAPAATALPQPQPPSPAALSLAPASIISTHRKGRLGDHEIKAAGRIPWRQKRLCLLRKSALFWVSEGLFATLPLRRNFGCAAGGLQLRGERGVAPPLSAPASSPSVSAPCGPARALSPAGWEYWELSLT